MKIYLDVSCLNRPFDDLEQARIRLEAAAVGMILEKVDEGRWMHASSEMARIEIEANPDPERRARVLLLLPEPGNIVMLTPGNFCAESGIGGTWLQVSRRHVRGGCGGSWSRCVPQLRRSSLPDGPAPGQAFTSPGMEPIRPARRGGTCG